MQPVMDSPKLATPGGGTPGEPQLRRHEHAGRILAVLAQLGMMNVALGAGGLVRNKVMALYLKPDGFGAFSQVAAIAAAVYVFVQFGMSVGLSRHTAAQAGMRERQQQLNSANLLTGVLGAATLALLLPLLFTSLSDPLLRTLGVRPDLSQKVLLAALLSIAPLEALRNNYGSFLQGNLDIRGFSTWRSLAIVVSTSVAVPLIALFREAGAAAQMVFASAFLAILLARRCRAIGFKPLGFGWDKKAVSTLAGWGAAALVSAFALNATDTLIRGHLIASAGAAANGLYQSATLISGQLMSVILGSVGVYSLATLSETRDPRIAAARMNELLRVIVPIATLSLGLLGLASVPLFILLFSSSFQHAARFFPLLLSANFCQAAAWVTGAPVLGFGLVRTWMALQLTGAALRYGVTVALSPVIGVHSVPAGFFAAVLFDLLANITICAWLLKVPIRGRAAASLAAGTAAIIVCAALGAGPHPLYHLLAAGCGLCAVTAAMIPGEVNAGIASLCQRSLILYRGFTAR
jgi:O-antigen/teichoic acid export membrane protein